MSVAKILELTARSSESFEDAIEKGIAKATDSVRNVQGAWVKEQKVEIQDGSISAYQVDLKVTFLVEG